LKDSAEWDGDYTPAFDVEEMKRKRMVWEAQQKKKDSRDNIVSMEVDG
jgi:hypothetical protein